MFVKKILLSYLKSCKTLPLKIRIYIDKDYVHLLDRKIHFLFTPKNVIFQNFQFGRLPLKTGGLFQQN